jgi:hypothetical protein
MRLLLITLFSIFAGCEPAIAQAIRPVHIYGQTVVSVGTTSALAVGANSNRVFLLVQNNGSASVTLAFGGASSNGIVIPAGGAFEPTFAPSDSIYLVSGSASQSVIIVEGQ